MIINVSDILKNYGGKVIVEGDLDLGKTDFLGEQFVFEKPLFLKGEIVNNGKALELTASATGEMKVHCARCYKELTTDVQFPIHETLAQDDGTNSEDEDIVLFSGYTVDLTDITENNFLLNVSGRYLCDEDCKGLCAKCGIDLNLGECNCEDNDIDPRWAGLAEIMRKSSDNSNE